MQNIYSTTFSNAAGLWSGSLRVNVFSSMNPSSSAARIYSDSITKMSFGSLKASLPGPTKIASYGLSSALCMVSLC